jgi:hypothetical protein
VGPQRRLIILLAAFVLAQGARAAGCDIADENGAHWRRAVAAVKYLPEIEAWAERMARDKVLVQYVLSLDEPSTVEGRCYWPLEVRAGGKVWRRYLVASVGGRVIRLEKP